jgi:hypothetical protein
MEQIAARLPRDRFGIRDLALMTLHFAVAGREHEAETIGDVLTRIGARAELEIRPTGHSPRRGLVTESSRAGNPDAATERQGGWAPGSKVMRRCREADDGFKRTRRMVCCSSPRAGTVHEKADAAHDGGSRGPL